MSFPLCHFSDVTLEAKLTFLRQAESFPEPTYRVEAIETHMSWVFLTKAHAYKLKKPVCYDGLDFCPIEARYYYCKEEVRLNRRLAKDIYLGVIALSIDSQGHLQLGEHGVIVDWLVQMRRLPTQHMFDYALRTGAASAEHVRRIVQRLAYFYRHCTPVSMEPSIYRMSFLQAIEINRQELKRPEYQMSTDKIDDICDLQRDVLIRREEWFDVRVRAGKIVEGHGDLRPEHICLEPEVAIIDCLEFSRRLRLLDPADEIGFLALECERLGAVELAKFILQMSHDAIESWPHAALVHFYQSFRACVRARLSIKHLDEERFRYSPEWRRRANEYLELATQHLHSI